MKAVGLIAAGMLCISHAQAVDYLQSLLKGESGKIHSIQQKQQKLQIASDKNITSDEELSRVLLSFEEEEAAKIKAIRQKMIARQKAEEEKKRLEKEAKAESAKKSKQPAFPSLEEQMRTQRVSEEMRAYSVKKNPAESAQTVAPKKAVIYGIYCKHGRCFALGDNRIYKEGEAVHGRKIMEITPNYVRYKDGGKEWYTR